MRGPVARNCLARREVRGFGAAMVQLMQTNKNAAAGLNQPGLDEEMRSRLAAIVESSDDAIIGKTLEGRAPRAGAGNTT